jgi:ferric-dicitrate binding protein FerR (iron transport regulator)
MRLRFRMINLLLAVLVAACVNPNPTPSPRTAELSELRNTVEARASGADQWQTASEGQNIAAGDGVRTGDEARARLDLSDGGILRLGANTEFELTELSPGETDPATRLQVGAGHVWISVSKALGNGAFEVDTPNGVAAVRGSLMGVEYYPANGQMIITCLEGQCRLTQPGSGQFTDLTTGQQTGIPGFGRDPGAAKPIDVVRLGEWAQVFPEALSIVVTITPGPPPTDTPIPPAR